MEKTSTKVIRYINIFVWLLFLIVAVLYLRLIVTGSQGIYGETEAWGFILLMPFLMLTALIKVIFSILLFKANIKESKLDAGNIETPRKKSNPQRIFVIEVLIMTGIIIAMPILIMAVNAPIRNAKLHDEWVSEYLSDIDSDARNYFKKTGQLPASYDDVLRLGTYPSKPDKVDYKKTGDFTYEICGNFQTQSDNFSGYKNYSQEGDYHLDDHEKGYICFSENARDQSGL